MTGARCGSLHAVRHSSAPLRPAARGVTAVLRAALTAVLVALVVPALAGCDTRASSAAPTPVAVEVTGTPGQVPVLEYGKPLTLTEQGTRVIWPGTGAPLEQGGPVLLHLYAEDGRDGTIVQDTFVDAPAWHTLSVPSLGANLHEALSGQRVGARLLFLEQDGTTPLVLVVDVLPTRAAGEPVRPAAGLPVVRLDDDGAPAVTIPPGTPPPPGLVVQPLVRGTGPQVEVGMVVTVRFTGVRWSDGQVFDTTWGPPPGVEGALADHSQVQSIMIGIGQVIEGWDQGLLEQSVGSQVMLVVPPSLGYGGASTPLADQTLVYVIDILDAHHIEGTGVAEGAS